MRFLTLRNGTDLRPALFAAGFFLAYGSASLALAVFIATRMRAGGHGWVLAILAAGLVTFLGVIVLLYLHPFVFRSLSSFLRRARLSFLRWRRR
jgi:hypothetical protein